MGDPSWAVILPVAAALLPSILLLLLLLAYIRKLWRAAQSARESELVVDQREAALLRSARMASLWRASRPVRAFNWSEHPSHVMTAVEHGWAAFAFSYSAPPATWFSNAQLAASHQYHHHHHHQHLHQQVSMWGLCHACANSIKFREPENTWNTGGAGEYMQQIRLNPGVTRLSTHHGCVMPVQAVQTAMPLPGPTLGPCPYPQESYFEVSILAVGNEYSFGHSSLTGSERVKLIAKAVTTSDSYNHHHQPIATSACTTTTTVTPPPPPPLHSQRTASCNPNEFCNATADHHYCRKLGADTVAKASATTLNGDHSNKLENARVDMSRCVGATTGGVKNETATKSAVNDTGCDDDELKGTVGSELTTTTVVHVVDSLRVRGGASLFPRVVEHADDIDWDELLAIGLAAADAPPFRLPGFEPSSIGFPLSTCLHSQASSPSRIFPPSPSPYLQCARLMISKALAKCCYGDDDFSLQSLVDVKRNHPTTTL